MVRAAALESLSQRGPNVILSIESSLNDEKSAVRYAGAAAIIHLQDISGAENAHKHKSSKVES